MLRWWLCVPQLGSRHRQGSRQKSPSLHGYLSMNCLHWIQNHSNANRIFLPLKTFSSNLETSWKTIKWKLINNQTMNKTTITTAHTYLVVSIYFRLLHYLSHFVLSSRLVRFIWIEPELKWRFTSKGSVPPGRGFQTVIKPSCVVAMLAGLVWFGVDTASQFWRQKYTM